VSNVRSRDIKLLKWKKRPSTKTSNRKKPEERRVRSGKESGKLYTRGPFPQASFTKGSYSDEVLEKRRSIIEKVSWLGEDQLGRHEKAPGETSESARRSGNLWEEVDRRMGGHFRDLKCKTNADVEVGPG